MERITTELISNKEFAIVSKGYDREQVDNFLDDICDEMDRMEAELKDLRQKTTVVREAVPAPAPAPAPASTPGMSKAEESSFREILEMARKVRDDTINQAKEDAEAIRARAEAEATDRLDGLNVERDNLTRQVASLKTAAQEYRTKFEQLLQAQQEALEKASDLF